MSTKQLPWKNLLILAFIACIAMISELLPSGFLQEMASAFNVPLGRMSLFIGTYAIMSAAVGIPITRAFSQVNRKPTCYGSVASSLSAIYALLLLPTFSSPFWHGLSPEQLREHSGLC
ncbi:hypothetical protein [Aerococcus mictus]|uniref:hypothetical protein n=1 Tax=Aerococcus mictus TaxID=2976810 RepID=UPI001E2AB322|nr:hypothetical protein [Aerococcus mictus]